MIAAAQALHEVQVIVHEKHLRRPTCVLFVNFDERVDAALIVRLSEVPVKVILPEDSLIWWLPPCQSRSFLL